MCLRQQQVCHAGLEGTRCSCEHQNFVAKESLFQSLDLFWMKGISLQLESQVIAMLVKVTHVLVPKCQKQCLWLIECWEHITTEHYTCLNILFMEGLCFIGLPDWPPGLSFVGLWTNDDSLLSPIVSFLRYLTSFSSSFSTVDILLTCSASFLCFSVSPCNLLLSAFTEGAFKL